MTSHELARKLLELPDLMVTVNGYEGGVDEIDSVTEPQVLALNVNDQWWNGKNEYPRYDDQYENAKKVMAIHIS